MTDLQIHSHSTHTLAGGELCAATESICSMFWEIQQNLTAGRALCDPLGGRWQTFKLAAAAVGCPSVLFVLFIYPVLFVMLIEQKKIVIFLDH